MRQVWKKIGPVFGLGVFCLGTVGLLAHAQIPTPQPNGPEARGERLIERMGGKDGVITKDETRGPVRDHFDEIDTNKDGKITEDELKAFHKAHRPPGGPCHDRMLFMRVKDRPDGEKGPPELDANKDGKVTLEEFLAGPKAFFAHLDADHNGVLESKELPSSMTPPGICGRDSPPLEQPTGPSPSGQ